MTNTVQLSADRYSTGTAVVPGGATLGVLEKLCSGADAAEREKFLIRGFAEGQIDWQSVFDHAVGHSVAPLVSNRLLQMAPATVPPYWRERFRAEFVSNAHKNLMLAAELIRVLRALDAGGLQPMPFKGPVLAEQAFGGLTLRHFTDLDIVLPHSQLLEAHRILECLNYRSAGASAAMEAGRIPGQYAYRSETRSILIEIHTERTMRYLPVPLDWKALNSRAETVSVGGQPLRTFSIEDTLMLLCVHGTKHFWTRLGWICDIAQLLQAPRGVDWPGAENLARKMRCHRMWLLGLALANEILAAPLPARIANELRRDARVADLALRTRQNYLLVGESGISGGERVRFRANSQDTLATGLRQLSVFATRPTDEDWQSRPLPRWASPLYAILRPLRMLRHYGLGRS
jgi:hypothetical protein